MSDPSPFSSNAQLCGECRLPIHPGDVVRHCGAYVTHTHGRCVTLLRAEVDRLRQEVSSVAIENVGLRGEIARIEPPDDQASIQRKLQAYPKLSEFFSKYALGSKLPPSCFVCGHVVVDVGVSHMELPDVVCCKRCKEVSERAAQPPADALLKRARNLLIDCQTFIGPTTVWRDEELMLRNIRSFIEDTRPAPTKCAEQP
jgi:hypothetical protein